MVRRGLQAAVLGIATIVMMGASTTRLDRLGHQMVCMCGCTQILMECNHVGCPVSPVMIGEMQQRIAAGDSDTATLNWFAAKYGAIVLASPSRGGFDNVAWIVPIGAFVLATIGTGAVVWLWKRRTLRLAGGDGAVYQPAEPEAKSAEDAAMRERIRRETEYR